MTNAVSFDAFLESIHEQGVLKWAISQRPNSDWVCVMVTNATFFSIEYYDIRLVVLV